MHRIKFNLDQLNREMELKNRTKEKFNLYLMKSEKKIIYLHQFAVANKLINSRNPNKN